MNTIVYGEEWAVKLQERLDELLVWKEICKVEITNSKVLHNPYGTDATVQSLTRGTAYTHQPVVQTDESVDINTGKILPQYIDRADLAQSTFERQMEMADTQGVLLNEALETAMLAEHAQWTNFGTADIGGGGTSASPITISISNIDDVIRGIKTKIRKAKGKSLAKRNGMFIVWSEDQFEILEAYCQANGFNTADGALKDGTSQGFKYMEVEHYSSNFLVSGHAFGGVKKVFHVGICRGTYGQIVIDQEPATADGAQSAVAVVSRLDFKFKAWAKTVPVLFDINYQ